MKRFVNGQWYQTVNPDLIGVNGQKGYTIAELLAVISIFLVISTIMVGIIYSTLRGSSKTKSTTDMAQSGQYVTSIVSGMISDSRNVLQINGANLDDCSSAPPPSSANVIPTPGVSVPSVTLKRIDGGKTILSCEQVGGVYTLASNSASLINTSTLKVSNCKFTCTQLVLDPYAIPIVDVSFTLSPVNAGTGGQATSNFNFSTSLRVYSP